MRTLRHNSSNRQPGFFWQAILIVLPVFVLAAVAFLSLRQDKRLAQSEAAERAQAVSRQLLNQLWTTINDVKYNENGPGRSAFHVDSAGQLLFPIPVADWPKPLPFESSALTQDQLRAWEKARLYESQGNDRSIATKWYEEFLTLNPSERFAAHASYALGLLFAREGEQKNAINAFQRISTKYPDVLGETGLPLLPFAQLHLLEFETNSSGTLKGLSLDSFCSNIVHHPTPLTSLLLAQAGNIFTNATFEKWKAMWNEHETARELYGAASIYLGDFRSVLNSAGREVHVAMPPFTEQVAAGSALAREIRSPTTPLASRMFWISTNRFQTPTSKPDNLANGKGSISEETKWFAVRCDEATNSCWFVCRTESEVLREIISTANRMTQIPEYFGVDIELAGKSFIRSAFDLLLWNEWHYAGKGGGWGKTYSKVIASDAELLGSATRKEAGADLLRVNVYLTSPDALFARQRARSFWFSALIGTSAAAALIGLLTSWRVFHRQQQLSELKSNFVSSVSHELRAPVSSVRLMAESLERGKIQTDEKQREYYRFIVQECRRLSSLVANVLDFSRIEQGRKEYEFEPTDLTALTEQTVQMMETYAAERQVALALNLPSPSAIPQPSLDGKAIQQALVNLIDNAIKHSPKGATVKIGLKCVAGQKLEGRPCLPDSRLLTLVRLSVEDTGAGIPGEEHEKIFERFYRSGSELRRQTQGVGIGLSIVKHIVEAHGGRVLVQSAIGQGSTFTIEMPV